MKVTAHTARKERPCEVYHCDNTIQHGQRYLRYVAFPGEDGHEHGTAPWVMVHCLECADRAGDYIRGYYNVPAHIGDRIRFSGGDVPVEGTIAGFDDQYLLAEFAGPTDLVRLHPTWQVEYCAPIEVVTS